MDASLCQPGILHSSPMSFFHEVEWGTRNELQELIKSNPKDATFAANQPEESVSTRSGCGDAIPYLDAP